MARQQRSCGLTLGDVILLVVLLVLLVLIFVPRFARVRVVPTGNRCGVYLSGIGKAMMVYANDYGDRLPRAGGCGSVWAERTPDWTASDGSGAFGLSGADGSGGQATISASLYLLVKYEEVVPGLFVCPCEKGATEFKPEAYGVRDKEPFDLWDFGPDPPGHCSYAYQMVYGSDEYKMTASSDPNMAVAADRNPWIDSPFRGARRFSDFQPDVPPYNGTKDAALAGNSLAHDGDAQHVLFLDVHVEFAKRVYCGVDDDNIYTSWGGADKVRGTPPVPCESQPADAADSLLVNDPTRRPLRRQTNGEAM
jgi:hypothetical protein